MNKDDIKTFSDKKKLKEVITRRPALKELLKKILQTEGKLYQEETWNNQNQKETWNNQNYKETWNNQNGKYLGKCNRLLSF